MHHVLQFLRNGKPHPRCVLDDGDSFIRDIEENHGRAQDTAAPDDVGIEDVCNAHKREDSDFLSDSLEPYRTRQFLFHNRTENSRDVVRRNKCDKGIEQIVEAAEELSDNDADARRIQTYR